MARTMISVLLEFNADKKQAEASNADEKHAGLKKKKKSMKMDVRLDSDPLQY